MADDNGEPNVDPNAAEIFLKKKSQLSHSGDETTNMNGKTETFTRKRLQEDKHDD